MLRCLLTMLLVTVTAIGSTQMVLKLHLPPAGLLLKSQLWNFSIINTGSHSQVVQVELLFSDSRTNQRVFTALSKVLTLQRGVTQITPALVAPVTYNTLLSGIGGGPDGFLPVGSYTVCFLISKLGTEVKEQVVEECESIQVEPLSPPLLVTPVHEEKLARLPVTFNWLPPGPTSGFTRLLYDFTLVEINKGQSAALAIQQNMPHLQQMHLRNNQLLYSDAFPAIRTDKTYAWQITVRNDQNIVARSEIWTFTYPSSGGPDPIQGAAYYLRLKRDGSESFDVRQGILKYAYENERNDPSATIRLYNITTASPSELLLEEPIVALQPGENFKDLPLPEKKMKDKAFYLFELTNSAGERWSLKFQYRKN